MINYKDFAIDLAKKAGQIMLENFSLGIKKEWKLDHTPLTIADTSINNLVIEEIKKNFPDHSLIGEEASNSLSNAEYIWICDPIDGTIPFSHGIPCATFSLALTHNGKSIFGVVYDPFLDRLFVAEKDKGAYLNGQKIYVSKITKLQHAAATIDSADTTFFDALKMWSIFMNNNTKVFSLAAYIYSAMLIAAGEIGVAIYGGTKPWDVAAVKIIVEEAGGRCTDVFGHDQKYNQEVKGLVASNGLLHDEVLDQISSTILGRP